jgi:hypothetical protein
MALSKVDPNFLNVSQVGGRRNLIINGAMQVAQRGTSAANGAATSSVGYLSLDRMGYWGQNSSTFTMSQETDAPAGFTNSLKVNIDATRSGTGIYYAVSQRIEANACSQLDLGKSTAKTFTTSFWVKSSETGDFNIFFFNSGYGTCYTTTYTINAANTWEYKTVTIPGPTIGTWATGTGYGLEVGFKLGHGTNWQATNTDVWQLAENFRIGSAGTVNLTDTLNATWQITGLQLEVGDTATSFEHRSYGEELSLCQRYYEVTDPASSSDPIMIGSGLWYSTTAPYLTFYYSTKRVAPTISAPTVTSGYRFYLGGNYKNVNSLNFQRQSTKSARISCATSGATTGHGCWAEMVDTSSKIEIDAEL